MKRGALLAVVGDDGHGAADSLADSAVFVELGQADPLAEFLALVALDKVHVALGAQGLDELGVLVVVAVLGQDAQASGAAVQGLGALVQATAKPVVDQRRLENLLERIDGAQLPSLWV